MSRRAWIRVIAAAAVWLAWSLAVPRAGRAAQQAPIAGLVVDATESVVPRARVRLLDSNGRVLASTFSDEEGRFAFFEPCVDPCRVEAIATGFLPATAPAGASVRLVLDPAPVRERVVVTPTRTSVLAGHAGAAVTVVTAEEILRRQARQAADLLAGVPGAVVVRTGGLGTLTSLFVRGGESTYNKVLLDGIPINEPGGVFNFSHLSADHLDRMEVARGAYSALFGSDAMASVVQLFTRRPTGRLERPELTLAVEGGTYRTGRLSATAAGRARRLGLTAFAGRLTTDNREPNNAFHNTTLATSADLALGGGAWVRVVGRGELGRTGTPGQTAFGRADLDAFYRRRDGIGGVTLGHDLGSRWRLRWTYGLARSYQASVNRQIDPPFVPRYGDHVAPFSWYDFPYDTRTNLTRHRFSHQSDWHLTSGAGRGGAHLVTLLVDWDGERGVLEDRLAGETVRAARDNLGWSVQHQAAWERVAVTAGVRIEDNASFGRAAVPRGSVSYVVRRGGRRWGETRVRASGGRGIKEPTLLQSFSPSPFFLGNPALRPERSGSVEIGLDQRWWGDRARAEVAWFANRFVDLISTRPTSFTPFRAQYFNVGRTRARGLEATVELAPRSRLGARAAYTFLASRVIESTAPANPVFRRGERLFRRPVHSGSVSLFGTWRAVTISVNGVFVGRRVDSDFAGLEPPLTANAGYAVWHLAADVAPGRRITWLLAIDNLFDADYMEPLGYPALRRAVRVGARVAF